jgi:hypothetical protein
MDVHGRALSRLSNAMQSSATRIFTNVHTDQEHHCHTDDQPIERATARLKNGL